MNHQEQNQMRKLEAEILQLKLTIKQLKYERDRKQKQLMQFIDITVELLKGYGLSESNILAYYQARRETCRK